MGAKEQLRIILVAGLLAIPKHQRKPLPHCFGENLSFVGFQVQCAVSLTQPRWGRTGRLPDFHSARSRVLV